MTKRNGLPCRKCGYSSWDRSGNCKTCQYERSKKWRGKNREKDRKTSKQWRTNNPDKIKLYTHKDRESSKIWKKNNQDKVKLYARNWSLDNSDKKKANYNNYRTRKTKAGGEFTDYEWESLCEQYKYRCLSCGKKTKLTADHIIPVSKGGTSNIDNIQPLCKSCNSSKGTKSTDYRTKSGVLRWLQSKLF